MRRWLPPRPNGSPLRRLSPLGAALAALLLLSGCAALPASQEEAPLPPRLLTREGIPLDVDTLEQRMLSARVIYLAEKHDNPHHHRLQVKILERLVALGRKPAVGFEFFSREQTGWLMNYQTGGVSPLHGTAAAPGSAERSLRANLGWSHREDWPFYFPLIEVGKKHGLPLFGADLPSAVKIRLARAGLEQLTALERQQIPDTGLRREDYRLLMREKLSASHCGHASPAMLDRLHQTWLARNDAMALAVTTVLKERPEEPVVVILGGGHTEHGMGVVERVAFLNPGISQLDLGLMESPDPTRDAERLPPPESGGATVFPAGHDVYWFTPAPGGSDADKDPCAAFAKPATPPPAAAAP
ncbi:MAG: ChaN family lipoprotein [Magnetococcales bacterium]|nr:ChaN family lipoprotein [Magnetococcales bacterium]